MMAKYSLMAKRFTDTDKWKKPFIRNLPTKYKILWFYIIDECDHAGIWQVDIAVAEIKTGEKFNEDEAKEIFEGKIIVFDNSEKWFIPSFIEFQYGELNSENRAHNSVINILSKYNLLDSNKPLTSPLQGAKDKEKDKVKVKIQVGNRIFEGKTSEWLMLNKESAIEVLMMKSEYRSLKVDDVMKLVDSETNQYHFKDDNHPYNYFKSTCQKMIKPVNKFEQPVNKPSYHTTRL